MIFIHLGLWACQGAGCHYRQPDAWATRKGKHQKAREAKHNNLPPFGYDQAQDGVLVINAHEAEGVRLAYKKYATGNYSGKSISRILNAAG